MKKKRRNFRDIERKYIISSKDNDVKNLKCQICGATLKHIGGFGSHLLHKHLLTIDHYAEKYFKNKTKDFKFQKCGFCDRIAKPNMIIDYTNKSYELNYDNGYDCHAEECYDVICLKFFNDTYANAKHRFEHIGANVEYLMQRHKKDKEYVCRELKRDKNYVCTPESSTSLYGFIYRHGIEEGTRLYNLRCKRISNSLHIDWFIDKYGIEEGTKIYE